MLRNLTLAAMHPDDLSALRPYLFERDIEAGTVLIGQGDYVETVYFPTTANLSNIVTFQDGRSAETFVMGAEGVAALVPFLADTPCAWSVEGKTAGFVYAAPAKSVRAVTESSPRLMQQLLRLTADYQAQSSLGVACAALHDMTARLARLILMRAERGQTDTLILTQQDMSDMLGCQRTSVNAAAAELKRAKAVKYARGVIRVLDRPLLRRMACECYELQRAFSEKPAASHLS